MICDERHHVLQMCCSYIENMMNERDLSERGEDEKAEVVKSCLENNNFLSSGFHFGTDYSMVFPCPLEIVYWTNITVVGPSLGFFASHDLINCIWRSFYQGEHASKGHSTKSQHICSLLCGQA